MDVEKLQPIESVQVRAVLGQMLERLQLASVITTDISVQAEELSRSVGDEISRVIQEQRELETRFEQLIQARSALKQMPNKTKFKENQDELHFVADLLRQSTKMLCRNLKDNPSVTDNILKIQNERNALMALISKTLVELEEHTYPSLIRTIHDEEARDQVVADTIERERVMSHKVKNLKQQIKDEKEAHTQEMRERTKALTALKGELKDFKAKMQADAKYSAKEVQGAASCRHRVRSTRLLELEEEMDKLSQLLAVEQNVHTVSSEYLRTRQAAMAEEALMWMQKHEGDTQSKDKEIEALRLNHQRDLVRLKELEAMWQQEQAEKEIQEAALRRQAELAVLQRAEDERRRRAAIKIQLAFRSWKDRGKPGKKKKKKKGGSPKKKK
eukprot:jgi/Mesvir1/20475/Mv12363-RA.1